MAKENEFQQQELIEAGGTIGKAVARLLAMLIQWGGKQLTGPAPRHPELAEPRIFGRIDAAEHVKLGTTKFDAEVKAGRISFFTRPGSNRKLFWEFELDRYNAENEEE